MPKLHARPADYERKPIHPDITEPMIEELVRVFYDRIRADDVLGPVFQRVIGDDWEPHLQKMFAFWSSVTRKTGRYSGSPMQAHFKLDGLEPDMFKRWLDMFRETAHEICGEEIGEAFYAPAQNIARSLELGIFGAGASFGPPLNLKNPPAPGA